MSLCRGIDGTCNLTKRLKGALHGSLFRDFAGGAYDLALAMRSDETPKFEALLLAPAPPGPRPRQSPSS